MRFPLKRFFRRFSLFVGKSKRTPREYRVSASGLAPDVLLYIFFILKDAQSSSVKPSWDWIAVTRVCRSWRNVALDCPNLWTDISTFNSHHWDKIGAFLKRSSQVGLKIDVEINLRDARYNMLELFKGHMERVREFKVTVIGNGTDAIKARLLEMTRCTKILDLRYELDIRESLHHNPMLSDEPDILPEMQLDTLSLDSVALPWSNALYHGLTELSISDKWGILNGPDVWQLIDILEHCPELRRLRLQHIFLDTTNTDVSQIKERKPTLSQLTSVVLADMSFHLSRVLFAMLKLNERTVLDVSFIDHSFRIPTPLPFDAFNGLKDCKKIDIIFKEKNFTILSNSISDSKSDSLSFDASISVAVTTHLISRAFEVMIAITAILQNPFWTTAEEIIVSFEDVVSLSASYSMDTIAWALFIVGFPLSTKSLTIKLPSRSDYERRCINGLTDALDRMLSIVLPAEVAFMRLPNLAHLAICNANFTTKYGREKRIQLLKYMEHRSQHIGRACKLSFVKCKGLNTDTEERLF